jgi:hypothetical protein
MLKKLKYYGAKAATEPTQLVGFCSYGKGRVRTS